jgi:hypothetical protein
MLRLLRIGIVMSVFGSMWLGASLGLAESSGCAIPTSLRARQGKAGATQGNARTKQHKARANKGKKRAKHRKVHAPPLVRPTANKLNVAFLAGGDVTPEHRSFSVQSPPLDPRRTLTAELSGDMQRGDGGVFPASQITVMPSISKLGLISLSVCADSRGPVAVGRGVYTGAIVLGGAGITTTAVPLTITIRSPSKTAIIYIALGAFLGLILKALADLAKASKDITFNWIWKYLTQVGLWTGVVTAFVAGIISYLTVYDQNATWGTSSDKLKLFLAAIALQTTGMTLTDVIKPFKP